MAKKTEREIEAMRAEVAAHDAAVAAERRSALEARLTPLNDLLASPAYIETRDKLRALAPDFRDDATIRPHLEHLPGFFERLEASAAAQARAS